MDTPELNTEAKQSSAPLRHTAEIVSAYVGKNNLNASELPNLISATYAALQGLGQPAPELVAELKPAVPIKKSITPDALISLEDGRPYKSLKRHLAGRGLTPDQYRSKWGLPSDYPMVAASYSARRSEVAKSLGLGRKGRVTDPSAEADEVVAQAAPTEAVIETDTPSEAAPKKRRGRAKTDA